MSVGLKGSRNQMNASTGYIDRVDCSLWKALYIQIVEKAKSVFHILLENRLETKTSVAHNNATATRLI